MEGDDGRGSGEHEDEHGDLVLRRNIEVELPQGSQGAPGWK